MASGRYDNSPRWHCDGTDCAGPERRFAPPAPDLAGQTCTAIVGLDGSICRRPAVRLDRRDPPRPICDRRAFKDLGGHIRGSPKHRHPTPAAPAVPDPSSAEHDPPPVAHAAQDPPAAEPEAGADAAGSDEPLTRGAARELIDDALEAFARDVLRIPATMAQGSAVAVHPVGLCDDGKCAPCRSQRRDEHGQARQLFAGELHQAMEWTGRERIGNAVIRDGSDALGDLLERWRDAGRPEVGGPPEVVRG